MLGFGVYDYEGVTAVTDQLLAARDRNTPPTPHTFFLLPWNQNFLSERHSSL